MELSLNEEKNMNDVIFYSERLRTIIAKIYNNKSDPIDRQKATSELNIICDLLTNELGVLKVNMSTLNSSNA